MPASASMSSPSSTHGLTVDDLARVAAATEAARAPSTRYVYALQWRAWERWCATRDLDPLPADPAGVAAYLADRTASGLTVASVDLTCSAIRDTHLAAGLAIPTDHPIVRRVRDGLRRTYGTRPQRQARALSVTELGQILARIDRTTPTGVRDAAILLLGYAGALRRSDLAALEVADIESRSAGLLVTIRRSKTDQDRRGQVIGIAHGRHRATDPVAALDAWLGFRGRDHGPVFTRVYRTRVHETGLAAHTVGTIIRDRAAASGLSADRITSHSLRAGHATTAALAGVPLDRIAAQTRHRSLNVLLDRYIRPLEALAHTSSSDLGLRIRGISAREGCSPSSAMPGVLARRPRITPTLHGSLQGLVLDHPGRDSNAHRLVGAIAVSPLKGKQFPRADGVGLVVVSWCSTITHDRVDRGPWRLGAGAVGRRH